MKKWSNPELVSLDMACTEYGARYAKDYDEVRVDQNGQYWFSYSSGKEVPKPSDEVIKVD